MDVSSNTSIIGDNGDIDRGFYSGYGYMYTKIGRKWIENGKIFPEDDDSSDYFGNSVSLLGSTSLFVALLME